VTIQAIIPIVIALRLQDEEDPQGCQIVEPLTLSQESMASPLFQNGLVRQLVYQCAHCPVLYCDVTMYNPVCQYEVCHDRSIPGLMLSAGIPCLSNFIKLPRFPRSHARASAFVPDRQLSVFTIPAI
jgi:hypothetical protein